MNAGVVIVLIALAVGYLVYRKIGFGQKEDLPQCHSEGANCAQCGSSGG